MQTIPDYIAAADAAVIRPYMADPTQPQGKPGGLDANIGVYGQALQDAAALPPAAALAHIVTVLQAMAADKQIPYGACCKARIESCRLSAALARYAAA